MCSVYPRSHDIYAWNAVDVRASDGTLQHGRVINVLHNGLVVDFDCPGRRAELVNPELVPVHYSRRPSGHTFDGTIDSAWHFDNAVFPGGDEKPSVEVLARTSAASPWTWHSAVPLYRNLFCGRYIFVDMQLDKGIVRRLMRAHSVRLAESANAPISSRDIGIYDFVTRACTPPADYWGGDCVTAPLWDAWKEAVEASKYEFWPVCVMGRTLVYLLEVLEPPLEDEQLEKLMADARSRLQQQSYQLPAPFEPPPDVEGRHQAEVLSLLPAEILRQVLDMLDTVQRAQCRRVCALWSDLIGTDERVIWVSFSHQRLIDRDGIATTPNEAEWCRSAYLVGMCLWKCLRRTPQTIIISNASQQHPNHSPLGNCFDLIDSIQHELDPEEPVTVIVYKFHWDLGTGLDEDLHAAASAVYGCMVWKDGTFSGPGEHFRREPIKYGVTYESGETLDVDGDPVPVHLYLSNLLEKGLTLDCRETRLQLKDWFADVAQQEAGSVDRQRIDTIMGSCQENDPRVIVKFGRMQWTVDTVQGEELDKLTKLTLCALQREMVRGRGAQSDQLPAHTPSAQ
ncbi:uncharacterized protein LOC129598918 [Paramacrobiotus metropolitanus]|uniref:uncharacterized protein LOC129598918 n=1 Tax=Paramacrobiotus metropolitanus TaxID=2943436 RepID=UPI0024464600|nr:uncharacterized protein LOC129598918 [Paramacrobiotus metropolitanus]